MSNPTDSDRATAAKILSDWHEESTRNRNGIFDFKGGPTGRTFLRDAIAAALAAERAECVKMAEDMQVREAGYAALDDRDGFYVEADQHRCKASAFKELATAIRNRGN